MAIGLVPAIYSLGIYLPQLLGASFAEGMPRKKPFVSLVGGLGERLPYLLAGVAVLLLAESAPMAALVALVLMFGISGASAGFATPAWFDMIAKVIPLRRRGLFTGLGPWPGRADGRGRRGGDRLRAGALALPAEFCAAVRAGLWRDGDLVAGAGAQSRAGQPLGASIRRRWRAILRRLPGMLRADRNFARYIGAMMVVRAGTMAGSFFLVYGVQRFQLGGAEVGLLTGVLIGCQAMLQPAVGPAGRPAWA